MEIKQHDPKQKWVDLKRNKNLETNEEKYNILEFMVYNENTYKRKN